MLVNSGLPQISREHLSQGTCCVKCRMWTPVCLCSEMPNLNLTTRVAVFMQAREFRLITNTGTLANRVLNNSKLYFRGHVRLKPPVFSEIAPQEYEPFVLFPHSNAAVLSEEFVKSRTKPLLLICPDGNWAQASKLIRHEPALKDLPRLQLPEGALSNYRLRRNIIPGRVCTYEAIAAALGLIHGESVQDQMMTVFEKMVTRILWSRGRLKTDQVSW